MRWEFLLRHEERRNEMKKKLALFVAAILLIPAFSFSNIFTFKAGLFFPKAKGELWQYEFDNTDLKRANFQNSYFGVSYEYFKFAIPKKSFKSTRHSSGIDYEKKPSKPRLGLSQKNGDL